MFYTGEYTAGQVPCPWVGLDGPAWAQDGGYCFLIFGT